MRSLPPQKNGDFKDNEGTLLEPLDISAFAMLSPDKTAFEPLASYSPQAPVQQPPAPPWVTLREKGSEQSYRPVIRPPTARLTILDDGEAADGETIRLRDQTTLIGRFEGKITLPHDPLVSARHAEIVRDGDKPPYRWLLRDLQSTNGTFVQCTKTILRPGRILILGSRRFTLQQPQKQSQSSIHMASTPGSGTGTLLFEDAQHALPRDEAWPSLVETTTSDARLEFPLQRPSLAVGLPGYGNDIELNDPTIAHHHARIFRDAHGVWHIEAIPSKNGVWVQVEAICLAKKTRFQCGEQRFLFVSSDAIG